MLTASSSQVTPSRPRTRRSAMNKQIAPSVPPSTATYRRTRPKPTMRRSNGLLNLEQCRDGTDPVLSSNVAYSPTSPVDQATSTNPLKRTANNSPLSDLIRESYYSTSSLARGSYFHHSAHEIGSPSPNQPLAFQDPRRFDGGHISPSPSPIKHQGQQQGQHQQQNHTRRIKTKLNASIEYDMTTSECNLGLTTPGTMYRQVKPLQTAFMSNGLLSKKNRNTGTAADTSQIPDTPCKKSVLNGSAPVPDTPAATILQTPLKAVGTDVSPIIPAPFTQYSPFLLNDNKVYRRSRLGLQDNMLRFNDNSENLVPPIDRKDAHTPLDQTSRRTPLSRIDRPNNVISRSMPAPQRDIDYDVDVMDTDCDEFDPETPTREALRFHFNHHTKLSSSEHPVRRPFTPVLQPFCENFPNKMKPLDFESEKSFDTPQVIDKYFKISHSSTPMIPASLSNLSEPSLTSSSSASSASTAESDAMSLFRRMPNLFTNDYPPQTPARGSRLLTETPIHSVSGFLTASEDTNEDSLLNAKFDNVCLVGHGEFSTVFVAERDSVKYAVKRTKNRFAGQRARQRRLEEVQILQALNRHRGEEGADGCDYVISIIDSWETSGHLYIMTEFCDNGSLDIFLSELGNVSRLDEWRVWKILVEVSMGLRYIHDCGFLHLDIKPANIFITFEGSLRIGDFGMATAFPANPGVEREGDREYIAPEVLSSQQYDKPADVFSLGIMMLEIAANIILPDNGVHWHKLRSGDLSDAGRLSSGGLADLGDGVSDTRRTYPHWAPNFLTNNEGALDQIVRRMLDPQPVNRPTLTDILTSDPAIWVESHRRAGAVIYEGDFGPRPDSSNGHTPDEDEEMINWN